MNLAPSFFFFIYKNDKKKKNQIYYKFSWLNILIKQNYLLMKIKIQKGQSCFCSRFFCSLYFKL